MDKKEKKLAEDGMKNALMPGMASNQAAFLDAASLLGESFSKSLNLLFLRFV